MTPEREKEIRDRITQWAQAYGVTMAEFSAQAQRFAETLKKLTWALRDAQDRTA